MGRYNLTRMAAHVVGNGGPVYSLVNIPIESQDEITIKAGYSDEQAADMKFRNNVPSVYGCETNCEFTPNEPPNPLAYEALAEFFYHQH